MHMKVSTWARWCVSILEEQRQTWFAVITGWCYGGFYDLNADLYTSSCISYILYCFPVFCLIQGKEYVFIANSDNLGAVVDLSILLLALGDPCGF